MDLSDGVGTRGGAGAVPSRQVQPLRQVGLHAEIAIRSFDNCRYLSLQISLVLVDILTALYII